VRAFATQSFRIGGASIEPFELPHEPGFATFGFEVTCTREREQAKVVVATDFRDWRGLPDRFRTADFVYIEANHDLELLRRFPNYASRFHLSNPKCGALLRHAFDGGGRYPTAVMLGHLSAQRNEPDLALETIAKILDDAGHGRVKLQVAPRSEPSDVIPVRGAQGGVKSSFFVTLQRSEAF
jgi:phosphoribosyl 1,2-cyclic phosphodiesterase